MRCWLQTGAGARDPRGAGGEAAVGDGGRAVGRGARGAHGRGDDGRGATTEGDERRPQATAQSQVPEGAGAPRNEHERAQRRRSDTGQLQCDSVALH